MSTNGNWQRHVNSWRGDLDRYLASHQQVCCHFIDTTGLNQSPSSPRGFETHLKQSARVVFYHAGSMVGGVIRRWVHRQFARCQNGTNRIPALPSTKKVCAEWTTRLAAYHVDDVDHAELFVGGAHQRCLAGHIESRSNWTARDVASIAADVDHAGGLVGGAFQRGLPL